MALQDCERREQLVGVINSTTDIVSEIGKLDGKLTALGELANEMAGQVLVDQTQQLCAQVCGQGLCFLASEVGQTYSDVFIENNEQEAAQHKLRKPKEFVTVEIDTLTGEDLKTILMARLSIFDDPEFVTKLNAMHNRDNPGNPMTDEEFSEGIKETLTPVKDDATWETFARFVKGNVRLAQSIFSFLQNTHYRFRSSDPSQQKIAQGIATDYVSRDGSWSKRYPGFRPANPYEITERDFNTLGLMIDNDGWLNLPDDFRGSQTMCWVTDNIEEYAEWRVRDGEIIELLQGNPNVLPNLSRRAIEAATSDKNGDV
ncbi:MAG: hypothetical protein JWO47_125 [Candidatus Saccharibacteria bacterium]|nr:hypothetical protein [Candidatus Saccharibacteria bacterium]